MNGAGTMPVLSDLRAERACQAHVAEGLDKTKAWFAGYESRAKKWKRDTIATYACRFFKEPAHIQRIEELRAEMAALAEEQFKIDAAYILRRHVEIDQLDVLDIMSDDGQLKALSEWPKTWRQFISGLDVTELLSGSGDERQQIGLLKKLKWPDKVRNLELLGKHVDVQAYKERVDTASVSAIEEMTDTELDAEIERRLSAAASSK